MRKQVYLFELDSVRKSDEEITVGQKALYDEIVVNGNTVVLTYNQLVDSRAFFSLLNDKDYYESLIELCKEGRIRVSQYGDLRTISQYILSTVGDDKQFIYSALPLKYSQKRLTALVKRSLMYSDLSEIYNFYIDDNRTKEERRDLFIEVVDEKLVDTELSDSEMREILKNLYWLLSTVLRLSAMHEIYILPKDPKEYENFHLHNILAAVMRLRRDDDALFAPAIGILRELDCFKQNNDNRSVYIRAIKEKGRAATSIDVYRYAEAIVNLCYNYACEASICNISKHYNSDELLHDGDMPTFGEDFFLRLAQDWNNGANAEERFSYAESNFFKEYVKPKNLPFLSRALRLTQYDESNKKKSNEDATLRYEYRLKEQRRRHRRRSIGSILKKVLASLLCVLFACMFAMFFQGLQDLVDGENILKIIFDVKKLRHSLIITIGFLFVTEFVTTILTKLFPGLVSLGEAISGLGRLIADSAKILLAKAGVHVNPSVNGRDYKEKRDIGAHINYVASPELKSYISYYNEQDKSATCEGSAAAPIKVANVNDANVVHKLSRLEELFHYRFGIAYKSKYNMMVVDPVIGGENEYYPYERITHANGKDGVVMVTVHNGNYVLLKQYRHALRKVQYAFPRGFAEVGEEPSYTAVRELEEEINAKVTKAPVLLGRIAPDSGLSSIRVYVYQVEVDDYEVQTGHEGIIDCVEVPIDTFKKWLKDNSEDVLKDDGFTLGACALL